MKLKAKIIMIISIIALIVFGVVAAVFLLNRGEEVQIKFPEEYIVIDASSVSDNSEYIEELGFSEDSFSSFMEKGNILYFAANGSNSMQFSLSSYSTDLSEQIGYLSDIGNDSLRSLAEKMGLKGYTGVTIENSANERFYELFHPSSEEEPYVSLQYVTIKNGKYYVLNYYGSETELSDSEYETVRDVLDSLEIEDNKELVSSLLEGGALGIFYAILAFFVSALGIVVVVLLLISIFKDIRKSRQKDDGEGFKIKRTKKYR